jgi:thymidine phosphorylase
LSGRLLNDLIRRKRFGENLALGELRALALAIGDGSMADAQVAAFAMAVACRGMTTGECTAFTAALRDSGRCLDWSGLPGPALDKHSTGGVGDAVSLLLAPMLAACGGYVPMLSGRGLGHTGGTLDKLESIPGYRTAVTPQAFERALREAGCAIVGQSDDLVPADRRLYAIRDATGLADVPALMVASILSKKLAGGAAHLVLDVKTGSGAQLPEDAASIELADALMQVARDLGLPTRVALSDMDQVLGRHAGNALEVAAVLDLLCGRGGCPRLLELSMALSAELLCMSGLAPDAGHARRRLQDALDSGAAADRFARMVSALGGPADLLERPQAYLPAAPIQRVVHAPRAGFVARVDVRALGIAVVALGGGRGQPGAPVDAAVGLADLAGRGQAVAAGDTLARVHARSDEAAARAERAVRAAFEIAERPPLARPLLRWHADLRDVA